MRSIHLIVLLFSLALIFEHQHSLDAQLVFYIPFRIASGIFRPLRMLLTLGMLRRRLRFTRRLLGLFVSPIMIRTDQSSVGSSPLLSVQPRRLDVQEQNFFKSLSADDPRGCLLRLVCELHATQHKHKLGSMEYDILEAFKYYEEELAANVTASNVPIFAAATLGKRSNVQQCKNNYKACPYNSHQIMMSYINQEKLDQRSKPSPSKVTSDQNVLDKPFHIKLNINLPGLLSG